MAGYLHDRLFKRKRSIAAIRTPELVDSIQRRYTTAYYS